MLDDGAVVPIYFYVNKNLVSPKITGWKANLVDYHPTRFLCVAGAGERRVPEGGAARP